MREQRVRLPRLLAPALVHDAHSAELGTGVLHTRSALWCPVSQLRLALSAQCRTSAIVQFGTGCPVPDQCPAFGWRCSATVQQCLTVTVIGGQNLR